MDPRRVDVPGYRVVRSLGAGGMGAVFLVEPEDLPGTVRALKVVHVQDAARRDRFVRLDSFGVDYDRLAELKDELASALARAPAVSDRKPGDF